MGRRQPNYRLVKTHRSYTVHEAACVLGNHKNTVREWIKAGLPTIDHQRPIVILGRQLVGFLQVRRASKKMPCGSGEMYCVRCHAPKCPAAGMADYLPITEKVGNLRGLCPDCSSFMHRCVSLAKIGLIQGEMDIAFPQALRHLIKATRPTVKSDLK